VPEVASRRHLELVTPVIREALGEARAELCGRGGRRRDRRPGLIGALLVGVAAAKAIAWARRPPARAGRSPPGHVASLYLSPTRSSPRSCACWRAAATPCSWMFRRATATVCSDDPRRRGWEAFDKGARLASGFGYPGGAAIDGWPRRRSGGVRGSPSPGCRLSTSRSPVSRQRCSTPSATSRRRKSSAAGRLAASYQRAIVRASRRADAPGRGGVGATRTAVVGGVAANSELRAALPEAAPAATLPLHRQRRDDRVGRALREGGPVSGLSLPVDAYASTA